METLHLLSPRRLFLLVRQTKIDTQHQRKRRRKQKNVQPATRTAQINVKSPRRLVGDSLRALTGLKAQQGAVCVCTCMSSGKMQLHRDVGGGLKATKKKQGKILLKVHATAHGPHYHVILKVDTRSSSEICTSLDRGSERYVPLRSIAIILRI